MNEIEQAIADICHLSYGLNYEVFLAIHEVPRALGSRVTEYIREAIGIEAVVGGHVYISGEDLLIEVEKCLTYEGHRGTGPLPENRNSPRFNHAVQIVLSHARELVASSEYCEEFWLDEGHPADPVFWDFAYLVVGRENVHVLIGSSSD